MAKRINLNFMKYGDKKHKILSCITKPKKLGKVFVAHLNWMKPIGNDYQRLMEIKTGNEGKEYTDPTRESETIDLTDAEFDMEKLKALLVSRNTMTNEEFDADFKSLKTEKYIKEDKFEADDVSIAVLKYDEMEEAEKQRIIDLGEEL